MPENMIHFSHLLFYVCECVRALFPPSFRNAHFLFCDGGSKKLKQCVVVIKLYCINGKNGSNETVFLLARPFLLSLWFDGIPVLMAFIVLFILYGRAIPFQRMNTFNDLLICSIPLCVHFFIEWWKCKNHDDADDDDDIRGNTQHLYYHR